METREKEIWKAIPEYEGLYEISNYGRVKSLSRDIKHDFIKNYKLKESFLSKSCDNLGYVRYTLRKNGKRKTFTAHRLVALLFIKNINNYKFINHKNQNKEDNYYKNLEWVNHRENISHRYKKANTTSLLTGVFLDTSRNYSKKYRASISINGKSIYLGMYLTENEAHQAYLNALNNYKLKNKYAY